MPTSYTLDSVMLWVTRQSRIEAADGIKIANPQTLTGGDYSELSRWAPYNSKWGRRGGRVSVGCPLRKIGLAIAGFEGEGPS